jgi:hypothetical protein
VSVKPAVVFLVACGSSSPSAVAPPTTPATDTPAVAGSSMNAPEITQSPGVANGFVILWPRIPGYAKDEDSRKLAAGIQSAIEHLVSSVASDAPIDVRPEPERACSRQGCTALAISAVLLRHEGGCSVVATIQKPGPSEVKLVPWGGEMRLKQPTVPFREPPEGAVSVIDYEKCTNIIAALHGRDGEVINAIRASR